MHGERGPLAVAREPRAMAFGKKPLEATQRTRERFALYETAAPGDREKRRR